jgi:hypothetical protein
MQTTKPDWVIPQDIVDIVTINEMWEDDRWSPILLTVIGGTKYKGRDIPLAWQIEFEPSDPFFDAANRKIEALGVEPDGYGWVSVINSVVGNYHPELINELQFGDTEEETCVVWVESEGACRRLMNIVWSLVHPN